MVAILWSTLAFADESAGAGNEARRAVAEALFQEGRELSTQGKAEQACPKFAESQRVDPATGTLLNLAACHESVGKLATAWSEFNEALAASARDGREDRVRFAKDHIRDLEAKLSHLTIRVTRERSAAEMEIRLDNVPVGRAAWGTALPVDPGKHVVLAHAPGALPWQKEVTIEGHAQDITVEVPDWSKASPPTGASFSAPTKGRRTVLLASVGVAATGIVAGSVFGLYAYSRWHEAERACPAGRGCSQAAVDARASANNFAMASNIAFGAAVVGVGVATYLWLTTPRASTSGTYVHAMPLLSPGTMGMAMESHF